MSSRGKHGSRGKKEGLHLSRRPSPGHLVIGMMAWGIKRIDLVSFRSTNATMARDRGLRAFDVVD